MLYYSNSFNRFEIFEGGGSADPFGNNSLDTSTILMARYENDTQSVNWTIDDGTQDTRNWTASSALTEGVGNGSIFSGVASGMILGEVLVYSRRLSDDEVNKVANSLSNKWSTSWSNV